MASVRIIYSKVVTLLGRLGSLLHMIWLCRVSVTNVVVSALLFYGAVQAQNLMADIASPWHWVLVFLATFLLWAFPVHYGARRCLDQAGWRRTTGRLWRNATETQRRSAVYLPRVLGLIPFAALGIGMYHALDSLAEAGVLETVRQTQCQGHAILILDGATAALFFLFVCLRTKIPAPPALAGRGDYIHLLALFFTTAFFISAYFMPIRVATCLPRALLVPPLFGSLILICCWLTRFGDRTGVPVLSVLAVALGVATAFNSSFNDLRLFPEPNASNGKQEASLDGRLTIHDAVKMWKAANDCDTDCPHPLVIAVDGGASRAAFTAATFIGAILDSAPKAASERVATTPGRHIFAISGVSGGAYGAAVIQAALVDAQETPDATRPPCRSVQPTWFGSSRWDGKTPLSWRQCLQALTSGDYLSPTIIGLAFRDVFAPPWIGAREDRAVLLETSWERHYAETVADEHGRRACKGSEEKGLCRRMAHPAELFALQWPHGFWMPMLLLNATSVRTGRRVISADLASVREGSIQSKPNEGALYTQAYDLRELMSSPCRGKPTVLASTPKPPTYPLGELHRTSRDGEMSARTRTEGVCVGTDARIDGPDIRLSTAAAASARFPIISPAAIVSAKASSTASAQIEQGDELVDGGYFENTGLTTAIDIVNALEQESLHATLISISNDPTEDDINSDRMPPRNRRSLPPRESPTPLLEPRDGSVLERYFAVLLRPFETLLATGNGHSAEVLANAETNPPPGGFYRLEVKARPTFPGPPDASAKSSSLLDPACMKLVGQSLAMSKVSMSWWLAPAIQEDIDVQRCDVANASTLDALQTSAR